MTEDRDLFEGMVPANVAATINDRIPGNFMKQTRPHLVQGKATYKLNSNSASNDLTQFEMEYSRLVEKFRDEYNKKHPKNPIVEIRDLEYDILIDKITIT